MVQIWQDLSDQRHDSVHQLMRPINPFLSLDTDFDERPKVDPTTWE
jgi:hypothetical protein